MLSAISSYPHVKIDVIDEHIFNQAFVDVDLVGFVISGPIGLFST